MINALNDDLRTEKFTHTCVTFAVSEKTVFFHYFVDFVLLLRGGEIILNKYSFDRSTFVSKNRILYAHSTSISLIASPLEFLKSLTSSLLSRSRGTG